MEYINTVYGFCWIGRDWLKVRFGPSNAEEVISEQTWDMPELPSKRTPKMRLEMQTRPFWVKRLDWTQASGCSPSWNLTTAIMMGVFKSEMREMKITKLWKMESLWIRSHCLSSPDRDEFQAHSRKTNQLDLYKRMHREAQEPVAPGTSGTQSKALGRESIK